MITYEDIKTWCKDPENQKTMVLGACFVLVFLVGFGTGSFVRETKALADKSTTNYTTKPTPPPTVLGTDTLAPAKGTATASSTANCLIKGNISSAGKKIYHVPGGAFYQKVNPEQCFNTEAEAVAAGFRKSSR